MSDVSGCDSQTILQCSCRNDEVGAIVPESGGKAAPASSRGGVDGNDSVCKPGEDAFRPLSQVTGKVRV